MDSAGGALVASFGGALKKSEELKSVCGLICPIWDGADSRGSVVRLKIVLDSENVRLPVRVVGIGQSDGQRANQSRPHLLIGTLRHLF